MVQVSSSLPPQYVEYVHIVEIRSWNLACSYYRQPPSLTSPF